MSTQTGVQVPAGTRNCVSCGRSIDWSANVCPYCGHDFRAQMMPYQPQVARSGYAGWAGGLIIASGVLGLLMGIVMLIVSTLSFDTLNITLPAGFTEQDFHNLFVVLGSVVIAFGAIAIIGGMFAVQRRQLALSILGGVFGVLSIGFFLGAVVAAIGIILLIVSRHEFGRAPMPPSYIPPPTVPYR